ncbi:MAG TPA: type II toxin-antitoxin system HicA family toxin [Candidatus Binatia bacterium]|jgi:predicted RNA binding protein YcfA (HicA-like mRNA interferase family)|nr:type II toxin-antitoxin system HicA family toxin [Candidatus Binatia bacterium]
MPKPKRLSGKDVIKILALFDFEIVSQRGSHVKLKRIVGSESQTLTIPLHKELDKGTANAIFRQACRYIDESSLREHFYSQ